MQEFTGLEYIKIDIANQFGLDKETWNHRLQVIDDNLMEHGGTRGLYQAVNDADEPILMLKAITALEDALAGNPTGFVMSLDATASGLQIMACLTGCHTTAASVNLIDNGKRNCPYQAAAEEFGCDRSFIKKPLMTHFYGSKKEPANIFGENTPELAKFYEMMNTQFPGAMSCMEIMQNSWQSNNLYHEWTLPDGHVAHVKVTEKVDKKIEIDELNHMTFTHRIEVNQPQDFQVSLAANIVHSVDGYVVREMYRKAAAQGFDILTIHDCFFCSPNHMNKLRRNYINILSEIAQSNLLQDIINEIRGTNGILRKNSNNLHKEILNAEYALS